MALLDRGQLHEEQTHPGWPGTYIHGGGAALPVQQGGDVERQLTELTAAMPDDALHIRDSGLGTPAQVGRSAAGVPQGLVTTSLA